MSELCLDCLNKLMGSNDSPRKYLISRQPDFCEECMQWNPVVIRKRNLYIFAEELTNWMKCVSQGRKR